MNEDIMKDIIKDAKDYAHDCTNVSLLRHGLLRIADRLERLVEDGLYITPKKAVDVVLGNPPMGAADVTSEDGQSLNRLLKDGLVAPADKPSSPDASAFRKFLAVKWLGMEFRRFKSKAESVYVANWSDECNSHVYEIHVKRDGDSPNCGWIAQATNDGGRVFSLSAKNRSHCELCALSAMKRYLSRGHRGPYRRRMAEADQKEVA